MWTLVYNINVKPLSLVKQATAKKKKKTVLLNLLKVLLPARDSQAMALFLSFLFLFKGRLANTREVLEMY